MQTRGGHHCDSALKSNFDYFMENSEIPLIPVSHQVGGHAAFLRFTREAVCKPFSNKEHLFYSNMPFRLRDFTPDFMGIVHVEYSEDHQPHLVVSSLNNCSNEVKQMVERAMRSGTPPESTMIHKKIMSRLKKSSSSHSQHKLRYRKNGHDYGSPARSYSPPVLENVARSPEGRDGMRNTQSSMISPNKSKESLWSTIEEEENVQSLHEDSSHHNSSELSLAEDNTQEIAVFVMDDEFESQNGRDSHTSNTNQTYHDQIDSKRSHSSSSYSSIKIGRNHTSLNGEWAQTDHPVTESQNVSSDGIKSQAVPIQRNGAKSASLEEDYTRLSLNDTQSLDNEQLSPYINPWSLHLYSSHIKFRIKAFLLLSDLTAGFKHPCILDLKMGTRQHGIGVSDEKRRRQIDKVKKSTSSELGVRLCGMQVYHKCTDSYKFQDKYFGRTLTSDEELKASLLAFLDDGNRSINYLAIPRLIEKLEKLEKCIISLDGYRFFASSLLLVYDGDKAYDESLSLNSAREIRVGMVDFAHSINHQKSEEIKSKFKRRLRRRPKLHHSRVPLKPYFTNLESHPRSELFVSLDLVENYTRDEWEQMANELLLKEEEDDLTGHDTGYVKGLRTLKRLFQSIYDEKKPGGESSGWSSELSASVKSEGSTSSVSLDIVSGRYAEARVRFEGFQ